MKHGLVLVADEQAYLFEFDDLGVITEGTPIRDPTGRFSGLGPNQLAWVGVQAEGKGARLTDRGIFTLDTDIEEILVSGHFPAVAHELFEQFHRPALGRQHLH